MSARVWLAGIFLFLLATRLLQSDLVWVEEGYPSAAAIQMLHGKQPYRDFWFDKPPLSAALYLLWGAHTGWPLRLGNAVFLFACCLLLNRFARSLWGEREGLAAAALLAWYVTFGVPSAVMAIAPDLAMVLTHAAAVYLAWRRRPLLAGLACGAAMLTNTKAVFVFAACALFHLPSLPKLAAGFVVPAAAAFALPGYAEQVWGWGMLYTRDTFVANPLAEGARRSLNWAGFHAAAVAGSVWTLWRMRDWRFGFWLLLAFAGVAAGLRFFPRYYFLLLVPVCLLAARALVESRAMRIAMLVLLLIPAIRFGPRLVRHSQWADLSMMDDSLAASEILSHNRRPSDTLLVWGYRPDIFARTRMAAGSRYLDSQPLTGVIADRHLTSAVPADPEGAAHRRRELLSTRPDFIVDGLGPYNPRLALTNFPDLAPWLAAYSEIGRTNGSILYRRMP